MSQDEEIEKNIVISLYEVVCLSNLRINDNWFYITTMIKKHTLIKLCIASVLAMTFKHKDGVEVVGAAFWSGGTALYVAYFDNTNVSCNYYERTLSPSQGVVIQYMGEVSCEGWAYSQWKKIRNLTNVKILNGVNSPTIKTNLPTPQIDSKSLEFFRIITEGSTFFLFNSNAKIAVPNGLFCLDFAKIKLNWTQGGFGNEIYSCLSASSINEYINKQGKN